MAHKTIPQAQANPLRALPSDLDRQYDSYRLSPALTTASEMLKLTCQAIIFGTFCISVFMFFWML